MHPAQAWNVDNITCDAISKRIPRSLDQRPELEGPVDGSDKRLEEGALLKLGWIEGDEEGCAEALGDPDGEVEGPVDG